MKGVLLEGQFVTESAEYKRERKARVKAAIDELKRNTACHFCNEDEPVCLDFHHIDPNTKSEEVGVLRAKDRSWATILAEIEKCVVVCANCHRKLHAGLLYLDTDMGG